MPCLDADAIFYEGLEGKKYDGIKAEILKRYVLSLENKVYPMDAVYPEK